jgi:hypothetical protein
MLKYITGSCKRRAARAQAQRRMRLETANAVRGREAAKGKREADGQGTVQRGCERARRRQEINRDMGAFTVAVAHPDLHSHALPSRTIVEALSRPDAARWQAAIDEDLGSCQAFECGRNASCPRESRLYQVALFFSANGWAMQGALGGRGGGTGSSMGLTLRTSLLPCVPTGQCA